MSLHLLRANLERCVQPGLVVAVGTGYTPVDLFPEEEAAIEGWAPHRRAQFALGRAVARHTLALLGTVAAPILFDAEGAPAWPHGVVGSISHKRQNCMVVVGSASRFEGVGVDLELDLIEPGEDEIIRRVCATPEELCQVASLRTKCRSPGTLFLSAKEAFFKLQFPASRVWLDWDQIAVTFGSGNTFVVNAHRSAVVTQAGGVFDIVGGWIATIIAVSHRE